ncbi:MAG: ABC transporter ATP-binding protein [Acidobacteria bacterium]|nr:ABC transporter ATP-binding protein [Acidobacteriota bacterium]
MLRVEAINVFYGEVQTLWDVSFAVNPGEIVTLVGSNGAGKTTLLKTISGLLTPRSGAVYFNQTRLDTLASHRVVELGVAHVPEGRRLWAGLTVLETLELGAYVARARREKKQTLEWVFALFPRLAERKWQLAETLSGGEQQMLAIARSLLSRPKLLMFDEPSLGLAPVIVEQVFQVIEEINRQGVTILLVEQNVSHALALAHRAYVLETGRVIKTGRGQDLLNDPQVKSAYLGL